MTSSDEPEDISSQLDSVPQAAASHSRVLVDSANRAITVVQEIAGILQQEPTHSEIRRFKFPPSFTEVFTGKYGPDIEWFLQTVEYFKNIVSKYSSGEFDVGTVDDDLLKISGQMIYFSSWVNNLDALDSSAQIAKESAERKALLAVRNHMDAIHISFRELPSDIGKALAAESVMDFSDWASAIHTAATTVKGFYFGVKDFLQYLDRVSQRKEHERHEMRRTK